jgi:hypothetical protein
MGEKIYGLSTEPYTDEDNVWHMGVLWFNEETGDMGKGAVSLPNYFAAELLQKHFRRNVTPLDNDQLQEILDIAMEGIQH